MMECHSIKRNCKLKKSTIISHLRNPINQDAHIKIFAYLAWASAAIIPKLKRSIQLKDSIKRKINQILLIGEFYFFNSKFESKFKSVLFVLNSFLYTYFY